jgi:hypothetical protein
MVMKLSAGQKIHVSSFAMTLLDPSGRILHLLNKNPIAMQMKSVIIGVSVAINVVIFSRFLRNSWLCLSVICYIALKMRRRWHSFFYYTIYLHKGQGESQKKLFAKAKSYRNSSLFIRGLRKERNGFLAHRREAANRGNAFGKSLRFARFARVLH